MVIFGQVFTRLLRTNILSSYVELAKLAQVIQKQVVKFYSFFSLI